MNVHSKVARFARKYLGRLVARLLQRLESGLGRDGEAGLRGRNLQRAPAVARSYHLRVTLPTYPHMGLRLTREMKTWATVMDHLALGENAFAADVAAQRLKALEKSHIDSGRWDRAQYLELIEPTNTTMITAAEESQVDKEYKAYRDFKSAWEPKRPNDDRKTQFWKQAEEEERPAAVLTPNQDSKPPENAKGKQEGKTSRKGKGWKQKGWKRWG